MAETNKNKLSSENRNHGTIPDLQTTQANRMELKSLIQRSIAEKNWEALTEIGQQCLKAHDYNSAIECFIEARHLNIDEPLTHKHVGDAYWKQAAHLEESGQELPVEVLRNKAQQCYQQAIDLASAQGDDHFLREFSELTKKI